jgi:hypothetical protein
MSDFCNCDVGDQADYWFERRLVARIQHICCECDGVIEPGDEYVYKVYIYDGEFGTHKTCEYCDHTRKELEALGMCPGIGELEMAWKQAYGSNAKA